MALKTKPVADVRENIPTHIIETDGYVQLNVTITKQLRKALKQAALDRDTTTNALVVAAISRELGIYDDKKVGA